MLISNIEQSILITHIDRENLHDWNGMKSRTSAIGKTTSITIIEKLNLLTSLSNMKSTTA
jgi:hypothetical protein